MRGIPVSARGGERTLWSESHPQRKLRRESGSFTRGRCGIDAIHQWAMDHEAELPAERNARSRTGLCYWQGASIVFAIILSLWLILQASFGYVSRLRSLMFPCFHT